MQKISCTSEKETQGLLFGQGEGGGGSATSASEGRKKKKKRPDTKERQQIRGIKGAEVHCWLEKKEVPRAEEGRRPFNS